MRNVLGEVEVNCDLVSRRLVNFLKSVSLILIKIVLHFKVKVVGSYFRKELISGAKQRKIIFRLRKRTRSCPQSRPLG